MWSKTAVLPVIFSIIIDFSETPVDIKRPGKHHLLLIIIIIIIRCQIWNRHWWPCSSKHLCHQTTSKNLYPYFVHLLPSYKDYQEMLFFVCPYRVCLLLFQLKIRIPSLYVYTHVLKIPFASS